MRRIATILQHHVFIVSAGKKLAELMLQTVICFSTEQTKRIGIPPEKK